MTSSNLGTLFVSAAVAQRLPRLLDLDRPVVKFEFPRKQGIFDF